jgi:hypothetical protein
VPTATPSMRCDAIMMSSALLCSLADKELSVFSKWCRTSRGKPWRAFVPRQTRVRLCHVAYSLVDNVEALIDISIF